MTDATRPTPLETLEDWRRQLREVGAFDNELLGLPAGGVRQMFADYETVVCRLAEAEEWLEGYRSGILTLQAAHDKALAKIEQQRENAQLARVLIEMQKARVKELEGVLREVRYRPKVGGDLTRLIIQGEWINQFIDAALDS